VRPSASSLFRSSKLSRCSELDATGKADFVPLFPINLADIQEEQLKILEDTARKGALEDGLLSQ